MFGILARKRPEEHVLGFGKTAGQHRRERILEALAVENQLVAVLFINKPEFRERAGEFLGTARPCEIFEHGATVDQKAHHQGERHAFAIWIKRKFHLAFLHFVA